MIIKNGSTLQNAFKARVHRLNIIITNNKYYVYNINKIFHLTYFIKFCTTNFDFFLEKKFIAF